MKWNKLYSPIFSENNIAQNYSLPEYNVNNNLQLVKNMGKKIWNITSRINYTHKPQELMVNNSLYEEEQTQNINYKGIYADIQSSYSLSRQNSIFWVKAKIMNLHEDLKSDMQSSIVIDSSKNQLISNHFQVTVTPQYQWSNKKIKVILNPYCSKYIVKY